MRAVLEGVSLRLRDSFDLVGGGERGRVSGGGARSDLWLRIVAWCSRCRSSASRSAGGRGLRRGAARRRSPGAWGTVHEAVAACVRTHGEVEPVPEWIEPYRDLLARYRELYPRLKP